MNKLNLKNINVIEIDKKEAVNIQGGFWYFVLLAFAIGYAIGDYLNEQD